MPSRRRVVLFSLLAGLVAAPIQAQHADFAEVVEPALDSVFMLGVVRQVEGKPEAFQAIGTGWVIASGKIATNAHVAEGLLECVSEGRLVAKRGWSDRDEITLNPSSILIHPAYEPWNARLKRVVVRNEYNPDEISVGTSFIPVADVAIIEVEAGIADRPLPLADPSDEPALSEPVVYIGYPSENISGFPTVHAVPGFITAKTDFFFTRADWADSYLLHYCGPVVGGASGSPILNSEGRVIGIISAAEHNMVGDATRMSFGFAYGQRVDLARELLTPEYESIQNARNRKWSQRMSELLVPPVELLENLARSAAENDGVVLASTNTVTRRPFTIRDGESFSFPVVLEPDYKYGFLAAAHDGSDINARVVLRDSRAEVSSDTMYDYYPVAWAGPFTERTSVILEVFAGERLLQPTDCTLHIYKYIPAAAPLVQNEANEFLNVSYTVPAGLSTSPTWTFSVAGDVMYQFTGVSPDEYDIDMVLYLNDQEVSADRLVDAIPVVTHVTNEPGTMRLELIIPPTVPAGSIITVRGTAPLGGERAVVLSSPPGAEDNAITVPSIDASTLTDDELWSAVEDLYRADLEAANIAVDIDFQQRFDLVPPAREFTYTIPANTTVGFIALAPDGADIDMAINPPSGDALGSDFLYDNHPFVALEPAATDRTVTVRISTPVSEPVKSVGFRILLRRP